MGELMRRISTWYNGVMPTYVVETPQQTYPAIIERGAIGMMGAHLPSAKGKVFIVTTEEVWALHGETASQGLRGRDFAPLFFRGGEQNKRLSAVEELADQMIAAGADRSSMVIGFGGGIVTDVGGFLAASFMRGVPVIHVPTTLLAQVDAALGGKTGVNLKSGKNLFGAFHQPHAVLIDPAVLQSLPDREYRAGLQEVIKHGIIYDPHLFEILETQRERVLAQDPELLEKHVVGDSVRIKAAVVSSDEKEGDMRRILNYGHTFGHALEAETEYKRLLHGEAVAWGMRAASHLAYLLKMIDAATRDRMNALIKSYGEIPDVSDLSPERLIHHMQSDKKTVHGLVHFVLAERIGKVTVVTDAAPHLVREAIETALHE